MALSAVGISVFAADHSKATLKSTNPATAREVPVKLIISDTGFSDVGVMLKYNTEKLAPAGAGLKIISRQVTIQALIKTAFLTTMKTICTVRMIPMAPLVTRSVLQINQPIPGFDDHE